MPTSGELARRLLEEGGPVYGFYPHLSPKRSGNNDTAAPASTRSALATALAPEYEPESRDPFGGLSPIDKWKLDIEAGNAAALNTTTEERAENRKKLIEAGLSVIPGPGNILSAKDAFDSTGNAYNEFAQGNIGRGLGHTLLAALGGLGTVTGLGFGRVAAKDAGRTAFIFAGPTAKTADHQALAKAQEMAGAGATREDVWRDTGWFQGVDGKWRFEIDDSSSKLAGENYIGGGITTFGGLDHPELRAAYPAAPSFYGQMEPGKSAHGSWASKADPQIQVYAPNADEARSVSLHEYQHPVQRVEGFSEGALPENAPGAYELRSEWLAQNPGKTLSAGDLYGLQEEAYRRAAGEVEARNVQTRMNMSAAERRATPPWTTQDVPDDQQIVRRPRRMAPLENTSEAAPELASKVKSLYNPPVKPERPFSADYPSGAPADDAGNLLFDIEGRPLTATHVAGRRLHGEADGGISPQAYGPIMAGAGGADIASTSPRTLRGDAGQYRKSVDPATGQPQYDIRISSDLTDAQAARVTGHEVSHHIDELAGQIPTDGLTKELAGVYDTLLTGREKTRNLTGPGHLGYSKDAAPREMMAEAIRAYMTDPNYLKTVAPKTAAVIRAAVNANPRLSKTIQFNALPAGLGLGALGAGAAFQGEASD